MSDGIRRKIMALLAQAEGTNYEEEAAVFLAKAQELMVKHSIEQADLKPEEREKIVTTMVTITPNRPDHVLWNGVCVANDVKFVRAHGNRAATLIGFPADLAFVQALVGSLMLQRETHLKRTPKPYWENGRTFNHSFRVGYASRVYARLLEAKAKTVVASGPGTELVLASKASQVEVRTKQEFPKLTPGSKVRATSATAYGAGKRAANQSDLSGGRNNIGHNAKELSR